MSRDVPFEPRVKVLDDEWVQITIKVFALEQPPVGGDFGMLFQHRIRRSNLKKLCKLARKEKTK